MEPYYYQRLKKASDLEEPGRKIVVERYEQIINDHWRKSDEAAEILRKQASGLMGVINSISLYRIWTLLGRVPKHENVIKASSQLIGMANSVHSEHLPSDRANRIAKLLNIKIISKRFGGESDLVEK